MRPLRFLPFFCLAALPFWAHADLVVVASQQSGIERLTQDDVINIYLGRYRRLASGMTAIPVDLAGDSEQRARFYRLLVNKSLAEVNAYWARLLFSGKTRPPTVAESVEAAVQRVVVQPGTLAYLERAQAQADKRLKIVFELGG